MWECPAFDLIRANADIIIPNNSMFLSIYLAKSVSSQDYNNGNHMLHNSKINRLLTFITVNFSLYCYSHLHSFPFKNDWIIYWYKNNFRYVQSASNGFLNEHRKWFHDFWIFLFRGMKSKHKFSISYY